MVTLRILYIQKNVELKQKHRFVDRFVLKHLNMFLTQKNCLTAKLKEVCRKSVMFAANRFFLGRIKVLVTLNS